MAATRRISLAEWESHKEDISALYVTENKTLDDVIKTMADGHGFRATKAQYVRKLKQWRIEKNSTNEKWKFAASQIEKRKLEGKETDILINGKLVSSKKLKKETARYAGAKSAAVEELAVEAGVASGVIVRTPPAEAVGGVEYAKIPWFQFQELLEASVGLVKKTAAPINVGSSSTFLQNLPPPKTTFNAVPEVPGSFSSLSTPTSTMWDLASFLPNDTASGPFQNMFGDRPFFDWDMMFHTQQPPSLPAAEQSNREARQLLGLFLGLHIDPDSPKYVSNVSSELESITIESHGGEVVRHVQQLYGGSTSDTSFQLLRYAVYLSSNGLLSDFKTERLLKWLIQSKKLWVLEHLIDTKVPMTEIFASNMLVSAARLCEIDAVRALLAKGVNPNSLGGSPFRCLALQEAIKTGNIQLIQHLLDAGADPNAHRGATFRMTALEVAISWCSSRVAISELLISRGADVNVRVADEDKTFLHLAVQQGNSDIVRALLKAGARVDYAMPTFGTALQLAARHGSVEAVEMLLEAGADAESPIGKAYKDIGEKAAAKKRYGFFLTPLQLAAQRDSTEMVQILLDAGAGVNGFPARDYFEWLRFDGRRGDSESGTYGSGGSDDDTESESAIFDDDPFDDDFDTPPLITVLQAAVLNNNVILVRLLLSLGADVDVVGARGTALQIAASKPERLKLVQLLLSKGADVNSPAQLPRGKTALQAAAKSGNEDTVELLLRMGADVNAPPHSQSGRTAVQAAAESGNLDLVQLLVNAGANVHARAATVDGQTCLQIAASRGDIHLVDYLLQLGVDVNEPASTMNGRTALQAAIESDHLSVAERLLEKGADVDGTQSWTGGLTALQAAVNNKRYQLAQQLIGKGARQNDIWSSSTPLATAVRQGATDMVHRLVDAGADVNRCSSKGGPTPLEIAASTGSIDMVRVLLDAGASLDGTRGTGPLQEAILHNCIDIAKLFLSKGVSPNPLPGSRESPLRQAVSRWTIDADMVRILLDHGARVNADHGSTLQIAAAKGSAEVVEILLQAGADVNARASEPRGRTALQAAVKTGNIDLVMTLLNAGADINARPSTEWGETALQVAASHGSVRMVQLLLAHSADVNGPPSKKNGATALQKAAIRGQLRLVLMLLKSGADMHAAAATVGGRTALEAAAEHGRLDITCLLLRNDDDTETMEARCKRAAKLASSNGHPVLARVLREWKRP